MSEEHLQERTEPATPRRREDARKRGQVLRSTELSSLVVVACSLVGLLAFGPLLASTLAGLAVHHFQHLSEIQVSVTSLPGLAAQWLVTFGKAALAPALVASLAGIGIAVLQVGFKPSFEPLGIKWARLNLSEGMARLVGRRAWFVLARDALKLALIGTAAYLAIDAEGEQMARWADLSPGQTASLLGAMSLRVGFKITSALLFIAALDYAYQRFDFERQLRMTRQQVKDEVKQLEGDPQIKSRIRHLQREFSRRRMLDDVASADAVLTTPTHLAVAIRYRRSLDAAPVVVAKGAESLASRIREKAREQGIPVIENLPLAPWLYRQVNVGVEIPESHFAAAADVLARAYRIQDGRS